MESISEKRMMHTNEYAKFAWLFLGVGLLLLLSLIEPMILPSFWNARAMAFTSIAFPALVLLLFLGFFLTRKESLKTPGQKCVWALLCTACLLLPALAAVVRMVMPSIDNPAVFNFTDMVGGLQMGIAFSLFSFLGIQAKKRSFFVAGGVLLLAYFFSYLGTGVSLTLGTHTYFSGQGSTASITLKDLGVSIARALAYFTLGCFCIFSFRQPNSSKEI